MTKKTFLDQAYHIEAADGIKSLYSQWADSYETEISDNGYATPRRMAEGLAQVVSDRSASILDYGCGTGLSGQAFQADGFTNIFGADPSPEMLNLAREKSIYSELTQLDITAPPTFQKGEFDIIAAVGVLGTGAAPVEVFDVLFNFLKSGQLLTISFNDHTLEVPEFPGRVEACLKNGSATLLLKEYGDHLPGINIKSMIYVLKKT